MCLQSILAMKNARFAERRTVLLVSGVPRLAHGDSRACLCRFLRATVGSRRQPRELDVAVTPRLAGGQGWSLQMLLQVITPGQAGGSDQAGFAAQ